MGSPEVEKGCDFFGIVDVAFFEDAGFLGDEMATVGVEDDENGNALLQRAAVALVDVGVARGGAAHVHVDVNEDEIAAQALFDFGCGFEGVMKFAAPRAPVGAEVEEDVFLLGLGFLDGGLDEFGAGS